MWVTVLVEQPIYNTGCVGLTSLDVNDHLMSSPHAWPVVIAITCEEEQKGWDKDGGWAQEIERWRRGKRERGWCGMGGTMGGVKGREGGNSGGRMILLQGHRALSDWWIGRFPTSVYNLTVHVVSVDFLGICTFVAFWDDLTPPGLVLLLADVLVKQAIWSREKRWQNHESRNLKSTADYSKNSQDIFKLSINLKWFIRSSTLPLTALSMSSSQASKSPCSTSRSCRWVSMGCSSAIRVFFCSDSKASV